MKDVLIALLQMTSAMFETVVITNLTNTHNLCFEQECEKYQNFLSENFPVLVVKFSIYT